MRDNMQVYSKNLNEYIPDEFHRERIGKSMNEIKAARGLKKEDVPARIRSMEISYTAISSKLIELEPELKELVEDTDYNIKPIKLPWETFFINNKFVSPDGVTYMGISVGVGEVMFVLATGFDKDYNEIESIGFFSEDASDKNTKNENFLCGIVQNIVNLINHDKEVETIYVKTDPSTNKNRMRRGKMPRLNYTYLRTSGNLKIYAKKYISNRNNMNVMYLVRGHWRHYIADRYKEVKDTREWIKPYFKGKGEYINKKVVVKA